MSPSPKTTDDYLAALPEVQRAVLQKLRETIKAAAPEAVESISYQIPTFKYKGRPLIYFGAAKNHCALYAVDTDAQKDELKGYDTSKGTVRFSPDKPLPEALVRKLVSVRINAIEAGATEYRKKYTGRGGNEHGKSHSRVCDLAGRVHRRAERQP